MGARGSHPRSGGAGAAPQDDQRAQAATRRVRVLRCALLGAIVAAASLTLMSAGASALIVHLRHHRLSYQPTRRAQQRALGYTSPASGKPVEYHGGPVMSSNTNYAIYWDPAGAPSYPAGYQTGINRYFEDLANDSGGGVNNDSVLSPPGASGREFAHH